ncbi:MAG: hypothetical protein BGWL_c1510 [Candidatus Phytoplasma cynodontis]|nr:MAG: hypothetical protein BGWL_c1510 [Candidatus Phytoplasma cynodontis]
MFEAFINYFVNFCEFFLFLFSIVRIYKYFLRPYYYCYLKKEYKICFLKNKNRKANIK